MLAKMLERNNALVSIQLSKVCLKNFYRQKRNN